MNGIDLLHRQAGYKQNYGYNQGLCDFPFPYGFGELKTMLFVIIKLFYRDNCTINAGLVLFQANYSGPKKPISQRSDGNYFWPDYQD